MMLTELHLESDSEAVWQRISYPIRKPQLLSFSAGCPSVVRLDALPVTGGPWTVKNSIEEQGSL